MVEFDAAYHPTRVPINALPYLTTEVFPPSQILPQIYANQANLKPDDSLDPVLARSLAAALASSRVDLGYVAPEPPRKPVLNPDGCEPCFISGIQPQLDGSFLEIYPEPDTSGQPTGETTTHRVTPNDWWYYRHIMPGGYVVQGRAADGTPLVFAGIASGSIGGDRYRYYDFLFEVSGDKLTLRDRIDYRFDIAGLEGLNVPVITGLLFVPLLLLWLALALLVTLATTIRQRIARPA